MQAPVVLVLGLLYYKGILTAKSPSLGFVLHIWLEEEKTANRHWLEHRAEIELLKKLPCAFGVTATFRSTVVYRNLWHPNIIMEGPVLKNDWLMVMSSVCIICLRTWLAGILAVQGTVTLETVWGWHCSLALPFSSAYPIKARFWLWDEHWKHHYYLINN